jgi:hypothetical protein
MKPGQLVETPGNGERGKAQDAPGSGAGLASRKGGADEAPHLKAETQVDARVKRAFRRHLCIP